MEFQQQSQGSGWNRFGWGAAAGAAGYGVVTYGHKVAKDAQLAKGISIGAAAVNLLGGNAALQNANTAMATINSFAADSTPSAAEYAKIKSAMQQLAQGIQNLSATGYLGISASTPPVTTAASGTASTTTTNLGGLAIVALAALLLK